MPQANKPATTPSLPGKLATRTDGGPASKQAIRYASGMPNYGDGQDFLDIQSSAPMAATPSVKPLPASDVQQAAQQAAPQQPLTPLNAPTQMPEQPVTHGAAAGAGGGPEVLNLMSQDTSQYMTAKDHLQALASSPDASPALKFLAQRINGAY